MLVILSHFSYSNIDTTVVVTSTATYLYDDTKVSLVDDDALDTSYVQVSCSIQNCGWALLNSTILN